MANALRSAVVSMRMPPEAKAQLAALAARHQLSESGLLAQLVQEVLRSNASGAAADAHARAGIAHEAGADLPSEERITLRLRHGDRVLAAARARARGMKTATYLTLLVHNHVRASDVLPPPELDAIKAVGAQLAALGRQLRMFGLPNTSTEVDWFELRDLIACVRHEVESARQASATVVRRNLMSWETRLG